MALRSFGSKVEIFWKYGNDGGKNVTTVLIEYAFMYEDEWNNATVVNPLTQRYTLRKLRRQKEYKIRLSVMNAVGKSLPTAIYKIKTGTF